MVGTRRSAAHASAANPMRRIAAIAMYGPTPVPVVNPPTPPTRWLGTGGSWKVAAGTLGRAVAGPMEPDGIGRGWPTEPVGSNSTQPVPGKNTSTHQWVPVALTTSTLSVPRSPGRKP